MITIKNYDQITAYGWKLLIKTYPYLSYLTIKNCSLTDDDCELILIGFLRLKYLDISDNDQISGSRLNLLGETCESLCVGSLNTDLWMYPILSSISESNTQLRHLEDQIIDTLSPISKLNNLRKLRLHQERCYEEPSAIDVQSFIAIANECNHLKELVITGEYGWKLRLNDYSIQVLANKCQKLEKFSLTGNSSDITDSSVHQLVLLPRLHSVSLTSFESITDEGLIHLISRHPALDYIGIKETSSISNATLNACIEVAKSYPNRQLSIFLAETKISKPKATKLPHNLKIVFEENLRPRRQSDEPSAMKMIAVVGMSAVILAMILITMLVVIVMPVGMLLMMLYENCVEYAITNTEFQLDKDNPIDILSFFGSQAFRYLINIDFNSIVR